MISYDGPIIDCHFHPAVDNTETNMNKFDYYAPDKDQIETLKQAGISKACGSIIKKFAPSGPKIFKDIQALNDKALELRDKFHEFYIPGIHIHPKFPEESCREIERCKGEGVRWIGELVGYIMNYEYNTENALLIMKKAEAEKMVVNFHCDKDMIIKKLCTEFPDLNFVLAHPSSIPDFDPNSWDVRKNVLKRLELVKKFKNLYLDISGTGIDRYGIIKKAIEVLSGPDKLLFGTDFPINNPAVYVQGVLQEPLEKDHYSAIFYNNFMRLTQSQ